MVEIIEIERRALAHSRQASACQGHPSRRDGRSLQPQGNCERHVAGPVVDPLASGAIEVLRLARLCKEIARRLHAAASLYGDLRPTNNRSTCGRQR